LFRSGAWKRLKDPILLHNLLKIIDIESKVTYKCA